MAASRRERVFASLGVAGLAAFAGMCAQPFDTTRVPGPTVSLGGEVFRIVCERVDVGENPGDVDFSIAGPACTGTTGVDGGVAMGAVGAKVTALAERRPSIVAALDQTLPASTPTFADFHGALDGLLFNLLPLYGSDDGRDGGTVQVADGGTAPAEDLIPQTTRGLVTLLDDIAASSDATAAFSRISWHQGYRPPTEALGLTKVLLGYDQLASVLQNTFAVIREPSLTTSAGTAWAQFALVVDVLRGEFGISAPASTTDRQQGTTLEIATNLLFSTDANLGTTKPRWLVRRDPYGMGRIATTSGGALPVPFVDTTPADGFADSQGGQYVTASGQPMSVASPFPASEALDGPRDANGRALVSTGGAPLFQFVDLDQSVLGALLHDSQTLVDPANDTAMNFATGASLLFGTRIPATQDYMLTAPCGPGTAQTPVCNVPAVQYLSYDTTSNAPMLDALHAAGVALTSSHIDVVLQLAQTLFQSNEAPLARTMGAMLAINDSRSRHAEAVMEPTSMIWDDLIAVAQQIAQEPGLIEDIIVALQDPATQRLGQSFAAFAAHRDRIQPDWTSQTSQNVTLATTMLTHAVDRTMPDTSNFFVNLGTGSLTEGPMDNRSVFERFLHLLRDLDGVELCNKEGARLSFVLGPITYSYAWPDVQTFSRCSLVRIPDAAVFYLDAIAGTATINLMATGVLGFITSIAPSSTLDSLMQSQSGITGFTTHPTPEAINRLVFQPDALRTTFTNDLLFDNASPSTDGVQTRDGLDVRSVHPGTLFAMETYDTYANLRPLVQAFVNHGAEHLFVELLSALHDHYPTDMAGQFQNTDPSMPYFDTMDGAQRYEAILVDAFSGDLLAAAQQLALALPTIDVGGGQTGVDATAALARMILDPTALPSIAYRDGRTGTVRQDGVTPVPSPNLYYLFADAMDGMNDVFAANPMQHTQWMSARSNMVDTFLAVDGAGTPSAQFHNRRIPFVSQLAIQWLRGRVSQHTTLADEATWATTLDQRLGTVVAAPTFASVFDLLLAMHANPGADTALGGLLMSLLDDSAPNADNRFGISLTGLADLLQIFRDDSDVDPLLHALAPALQRSVPTTQGSNTHEEFVPTALRFLDRAQTYDSAGVLNVVLANAVTRPSMPQLADEPLVVIGDAIAATHRTQPGVDGALSPADVQSVFRNVAEFFSDGSRGFEQFYYIVQHRRID